MKLRRKEDVETSSTRRRVGIVGVLIGLPLLSNIASFVIFAPLFAPGQAVVPADFQRVGVYLGIAVFIIELMGLLLVIWSLHGENTSLKDVVNFQRGKLRTYLFIGLIALLPTLAAGCMSKHKYGQG